MIAKMADLLKQPGVPFIAALAGAAVLFRIWIFLIALIHLPVSAEEAWPGLMASHILEGELPAIYWGQPYLGTALSYLHAPIIAAFGATTFSIRLLDLISSLLFVLTSFFLARKIYGRETAITTVALLAIPVPYLAMSGALVPPDNYLALMTTGSLCLLLLADLTVGDKPVQRPWKFALLGGLLGLAFWIHLIMISYMAVVLLFLFLRDKFFFARRGFWLMSTAFLAGSLPLWWYNMTNGFVTFRDVASTASLDKFIDLAKTLPTMTMQFIIGTKVMLYADNSNHVALPFPVSAAVWTTVTALILTAVISRRHQITPLFRLSLRGADGTGMLIIFMLTVLLAFCKSTRSNWDSPRYIMPLLSALPILMASGLVIIKKKSGAAFAAVLIALLAVQAWGNTLLVQKWQDPEVVAYVLDLPGTGDLLSFLKKQNIRHAYSHYWFSYRLNYETREELLVARPYNERFPGRAVRLTKEVSEADRVAYIMHKSIGPGPDYFELLLKRAGGSFRRTNLGIFTVFHDFKPPYGPGPLQSIPHDKWIITANNNTNDLRKMLEPDLRTAWTTGTRQTPGMWLQIDTGTTQSIAMIDFDLGEWTGDCASGYDIDVSTDGRNWKTIYKGIDVGSGLYWTGTHPRFVIADSQHSAAFPPATARFVRITVTQGHPANWWTIARLRIYSVQISSGDMKGLD